MRKQMKTQKKREWVKNIGLLLVTLVVCFIVLEIGARVFVEAPPASDKGWYQPSENPVLVYELTRGKKGILAGYAARVNEEGRRDSHVGKLEHEGIAFVGDSFVLGQGVEQQHTLSQQFEDLWNANSSRKIAALNFGIGGYNLEQEVELIREAVVEKNVSTIFVIFYINDIESKIDATKEFQEHVEKAPWYLTAYNLLLKYSRFAAWTKFQLSSIAYRKGITNQAYVQWYENLYNANGTHWKNFAQNLSLLGSIQKETGIKIVIVMYPTLSTLNEKHPYLRIYEQVEREAQAAGLQTANLFDAFNGKDATALRANIYDNHPNVEAHRIAAHALGEPFSQLTL